MNWLTNVVYYRVQYYEIPNTEVHSGFFTAYTSVAPQVINPLRDLLNLYPSASILITGHSLGGALATFAAIDIKRKLKINN